ncbi:putative glycine dehydrogenase [decarboxylating] subunit 2 [Paenibacillus larvae subsp. larvae]|uniref:Probable glycine dehydrogenase (decarboxylating) subunit 2 n=1 Tax=Paenibacillus larvae subsp. larvae TaxID=147375 RepID=A0A2L1U9Q5_9BACL|nr:aminomethyl-transferring glycine dehydrogenase subunit GcvPB [Paenibacillus larvae]AQZ47530.1 glycine dehydrogenase (aminomethyl-transferring) [Paenibacillus larvae subsp. pulvifaciens]AVF24888.1 putative glycine dehydrogenase [decarboxylating] subunit 2 [Paenibacillus larvae subsp. larvae]AVF29651.1 putative glycine dehydrogenase [decarboxylating] subunit 2 [Paenibacillus larvae subsp. larvae]MBH0341251.1 glycine dehydrogenase [Paenibacillus larvae]MCY7521332.1 aminomethyl-transferring gly
MSENKHDKALIFEMSSPGRVGYSLPDCDVPEQDLDSLIPKALQREKPAELPEVYEVDVIRHYTALSRRNFGIDNGFYPLGSCTMKYNPKINEDIARIAGFAHIHPYQPEESIQGALELLYNLQQDLAEITGMDQVTLQPAAGAHGEWTGLMMIRAYHESRGEKRTKVIVPDSAHGTNPASASSAGFDTVTVKSNERGLVNLDELKTVVGPDTAALMLTNPNTLGLFEEDITEIARVVHEAGGLLYYDGANANAIMGITRPGDMGFDVVHMNLHKTMSTPHGGGGPGAGPVGVKSRLIPYLPAPIVDKREDGTFYLNSDFPESIGRVKSFYGNFGILVRAYTYIRTYGPDGLRKVSEYAVLNANYMLKRLAPYFDVPFNRFCKHEFVLSGTRQKKLGVKTLDMAKRLLDFAYHPPTIYFPLNVEECIMIEPTETESKETLDGFIDTMIRIANESEENPELVINAPYTTTVSRLDEAGAARKPILNCSCG